MGILDYAKITDKGIADAVGESLQMTFINLLSVEMTAAAIVLGEKKKLLTDNLQMFDWGQAIFLFSSGSGPLDSLINITHM